MRLSSDGDGDGDGDGAFSLIGLTEGRTGEGCRTDPGVSFHRVEDANVKIGEGLGGRCLPDAFDIGVCKSANLET